MYRVPIPAVVELTYSLARVSSIDRIRRSLGQTVFKLSFGSMEVVTVTNSPEAHSKGLCRHTLLARLVGIDPEAL